MGEGSFGTVFVAKQRDRAGGASGRMAVKKIKREDHDRTRTDSFCDDSADYHEFQVPRKSARGRRPRVE